MNILKGFFSLMIVLAVVLAVLFVDFVYKTFSYQPRHIEADAIVVLTGGKGRVEEGVKLFRERKGKYLYFIGVDPVVKKSDLYHPTGSDPSADAVFLEKSSRNTLENAIFGRDVICRQNVRSILLITSRYHMKRASILFRNALPKDLAIYPYPVDSGNVKEEWWSYRGSFRLLFREFYKYCLFRLLFLIAPGELREGQHLLG